MTSPDARRGRLWVANARLGTLEYRARWPVPVYVVGSLAPAVLGLLVYVLIGRLAAGPTGMVFAYIGCVVLAVRGECVSAVSDIPIEDAAQHRYPLVRRGSLPPVIQYTGRAVSHAGSAVLTALVTALVLGAVVGASTGQWPVLGRVLLALPLLAAAVPSALMAGLAATAPAIGNSYQNLAHNTASAIVTVCSGAVFPTSVSPVLDAVAAVMPLHHTVLAARALVAGEPVARWAGQVGLELAVGAGWGAFCLVTYAWFDQRGRRTGRGAFAA